MTMTLRMPAHTQMTGGRRWVRTMVSSSESCLSASSEPDADVGGAPNRPAPDSSRVRRTGIWPEPAVSTSLRNSTALWYRANRSLARAWSTTVSSAGDTFALIELGLTGVSLTCWYATATGLSPRNGARPASISKRTTPVEYRSVRASTDSPLACSGEKYDAVPRMAVVCATVVDESEMARAMPKSITLTWPVLVIMMLPGLMSRCTTPARWEYSSAVRTPSMMRTASAGASGPSRMMSLSRRPSTYSMTMNGICVSLPLESTTVSSPASKTRTMVGCAIRAAACASWRKRVRNAGSAASDDLSSLMATVRPSRESVPMWTSAMPPRPMSAPTRYRPASRRPSSVKALLPVRGHRSQSLYRNTPGTDDGTDDGTD